ncbi:MAG TPA: zf-HC2 domain-containing protein [Bacteroidota bacterium]|nr:zf-HC2 domain-containing protein [Bacteroidota bacterium]
MNIHPTEAELVLLIEEKAPEAQAARIRAHLAECEECTEQVAFLLRLPSLLSGETPTRLDPGTFEKARYLASHQNRFRFLTQVFKQPAGIAVAVLLLVAVGISIPFLYDSSPPTRLRTGLETESALRLFPEDGSTLDTAPLELRWTKVPHAVEYYLTVYEEAGTVLWRGNSTDTLLRVASAVEFESGKSYFWSVEALLPDRTVYRSKLHAFRFSSP